MRIAIINWRDLAHSEAGGAEVFVHEVGNRWADAGHEVTLYSSLAKGLTQNDVDGRLRITRIGHLKSGSHHLRAPRYAREDKPHAVLESINTIPYFLPTRSKEMPPFLPLVHQLALDVWGSHLPQPLAAIAAWGEPRLYRAYREVHSVAVSESTKSDLMSAGLTRIEVVPQGGIGPQLARQKEKDPTIIFVGRLSPNKRPDHAIEAFGRLHLDLPSARMWMVGEGEMKSHLLKNLPPNIEVLGRLSRNELMDRMGRAHVLIATSVREGWGLVVTEANALGTPAVSYDVPGLRDSVIPGATGLLVDPNPAALAREVVNLLADSEKYRRIRAAAMAWGASRSWSATSLELMDQLRLATMRSNRSTQVQG